MQVRIQIAVIELYSVTYEFYIYFIKLYYLNITIQPRGFNIDTLSKFLEVARDLKE